MGEGERKGRHEGLSRNLGYEVSEEGRKCERYIFSYCEVGESSREVQGVLAAHLHYIQVEEAGEEGNRVVYVVTKREVGERIREVVKPDDGS